MVISNHPEHEESVRSFGLPYHHVVVTSGQHLLDIEVQIGKRGQIDLKELTRSVRSRKRCRERIRLPYGFRVKRSRRGSCMQSS